MELNGLPLRGKKRHQQRLIKLISCFINTIFEGWQGKVASSLRKYCKNEIFLFSFSQETQELRWKTLPGVASL